MEETSTPTARWFYWELGLLCSLAAMASSPIEGMEYGGFSIVAFLFMWGLIRP